MILSKRFLLFSLSLLLIQFASAQDPTRFADEIKPFLEESGKKHQGAIVFTGSSSVRFWKSLAEDFPDKQVINRGFGGSQMSDLIHYHADLIVKYQPKQVFIYEGDNDVSAGKSTREIMKDTRTLVKKLRKAMPNTPIVFISPKPSVARWNLKSQYEETNATMAAYCQKKSFLTFVDVWKPMLDESGAVRKDIFVEDNLHMNAAGYDIWAQVIGPYLL
ncbi:MAG: SGNH/GDSL hydrolase family protein [Bacteroidota bacterium]